MAKGKRNGSKRKDSKRRSSGAASSVPGGDVPESVQRSGKKAQHAFLEVRAAVLDERKDPKQAEMAAYEALARDFEQVGDRWKRKDKKGGTDSGAGTRPGAGAAAPATAQVVSPIETLEAEPPEASAVMPLAGAELASGARPAPSDETASAADTEPSEAGEPGAATTPRGADRDASSER
jgi:hypothetical protein